MSLAVDLLLYAMLACIVTPRLLPRLTGMGRAPTIAVAVWLMVLTSVVASVFVATVALTAHVAWPGGSVFSACFSPLCTAGTTSHIGAVAQLFAVMLAITLAGFVSMLTVRVARSLRHARASSAEHARSARIIGRRVAGVDGLVIDAPEKVAYCVAAHPGAVIITSAAVAALDPDHLEAVLAHERAHLNGRHHLLLTVTRALASSLPRLRLFMVAATEVARLLEMCADDRAARDHGNGTVLRALLTLAGAAPIPQAALGASTIGVGERVIRLANPGSTTHRARSRIQLIAFGAAVAIALVLATSEAVHVACVLLAS